MKHKSNLPKLEDFDVKPFGCADIPVAPIETDAEPAKPTTVRLHLIAEIEVDPTDSQDATEQARAKLDAFRESVLPYFEHGIMLYEDPTFADLVATLEAGKIDCWVHNAAITNDIEALRKICLAYSAWWNARAWPTIHRVKG